MGCRYHIRPTKTFHDPVESKTLRLGLHKQLIFTAFDPSKGAAESSPSLVPAPRPTLSMLGTFHPTEPHRHSQAFGGDMHFLSLSHPASREIVGKGWSGLQSVDWAADGTGLFVSSVKE